MRTRAKPPGPPAGLSPIKNGGNRPTSMGSMAQTELAPVAETSVGTLQALLALVDAIVRELRTDTAALPPVTLASQLDRDLGFDSLARAELLLRVESAFGVSLPDGTLGRVETVGDVHQALQRARRAPAATRPPAAPAAAPHEPTLPAPAGTDGAATLLEVLAWHVQAHPDRTQLTLLQDDVEHAISYGQLAQHAAAVAAGLQGAGVAPRETIAIMLPTCPEYFGTYLGVLMAGAIPVPMYPPSRPSQIEDHVLRHSAVLDNARAAVLVTSSEGRTVGRLLRARVPGLRRVVTPQQLVTRGGTATSVTLRGDDIAFLQYTSGSTGSPKGVVLTHANLLANIRAMAEAIKASPADVFVSWLPLYHDMGLIGAWLGSLHVGGPLVVMPPQAFLARPLRWLETIHRWRGTLTAAPNFAYELCLKRAPAAPAGLDLSSLRLAFNGAEAVSPATVTRFAQRFASCGLRPEAMAPVYGLAEATVGLLFPPLGRVAPIDAVQREPFTRSGRALRAATAATDALRFVGCGRPLPGHEVRIVNAAGCEAGEREEGRLEFRGPSATSGYFRDPARTAQLMHDGWLDTGDRAYRAEGDIYITGRVKDIVIRGGRHFYPEEIEDAVGRVDGIRHGCVAVFGSADAASGTERLVVLAEVRPGTRRPASVLREAVIRAVTATVGEPPDDVVLAPARTVLKTSSGKIRRSACRGLYESGVAGRTPAPVRLQLLRLWLGTVAGRMRAAPRSAGHLLFGAYAGTLFCLLAPPAWLLALAMGTPARTWRLSRAVTRLLFALTAIQLRVRGLEHLPKGPCVLVSNHASYLDGAILLAALRRPCMFVAKDELRLQPAVGIYLRRLGAAFVQRFATERAMEEASAMANAVAAGASIIVFPEGTFGSAAGLLPFHLGAFLAAARAGVPVVPVAIVGSRGALPADSWCLRRTALQVVFCEAIHPAGRVEPFESAVRSREAARRAIAARLAAASRWAEAGTHRPVEA